MNNLGINWKEDYLRVSLRFRLVSIVGIALLVFAGTFSLIGIANFVKEGISGAFWQETGFDLTISVLLHCTVILIICIRSLLLLRGSPKWFWLSELFWSLTILTYAGWAIWTYWSVYDCFYAGRFTCVDVSPPLIKYASMGFQRISILYILLSFLKHFVLVIVSLFKNRSPKLQ